MATSRLGCEFDAWASLVLRADWMCGGFGPPVSAAGSRWQQGPPRDTFELHPKGTECAPTGALSRHIAFFPPLAGALFLIVL